MGAALGSMPLTGTTGVTFFLVNCVICVGIIFSLTYMWNRRRLYYYGAKVPGPFAWPIIGNALEFVGKHEALLNVMHNTWQKYNPVTRFWLGHRLLFVVFDPKDVEVVLNISQHKFDVYDLFKQVFGNGVFTAPVDLWKKHRKIVMSTFNQRTLNRFVDTFAEEAEVLVEKLEHVKGDFDVFPYISRCTVDMIIQTAINKTLNGQSQNEKVPIGAWIDEGARILIIRAFKVWLHVDFIWKRTHLWKELEKIMTKARKFYREAIAERRAIMKEQALEGDCFDETRKKPLVDYLIELADEGHVYNDEQLIDELVTITITGSGTTASGDAFTLVMLGMHQDIQEKVYEELYSIFGNSDRRVAPEDLPKMKYLDQAIRESLRLFPTAPLYARQLVEDCQIGSTFMPKGSACMVLPICTQRDPKVFTDPLKYDPDRWLPEEVAKRHPYSFLPFSMGPRQCLAINYGYMSMKVVLATVLRRFKVSTPYKTVSEVKVKGELVLRTVHGHNISLVPRAK